MFLGSKKKTERALQGKSPVYIDPCAGTSAGSSGPGQRYKAGRSQKNLTP